MKIGIDATNIGLSGVNRAGVYQYVFNLVLKLAEIDEENEYLLFFNFVKGKHLKTYHEVCSLFEGRKNFKTVLSRIPRKIWVSLHLPVETFTGRVDVFHGGVYFTPVFFSKYVITIYDMAYLRMPEILNPEWAQILSRNDSLSTSKLKWYRDYISFFEDLRKRNPLAVQKTDLIIAISDFTKNDIVEGLSVPEKKVKVIHLGVSPCFVPINDKELIENSKMKYNINDSYILFVSELKPNKNVIRLVEAFGELKQSSSNIKHKLVIVGGKTWYYDIILQRVRDLRLENDVIFTGFVPVEDLPSLYNGADLFVFPSLFEGFGIPVLEAMACGTPVVSSNATSLPEVVGDAGIMVDPYSTNDIATAIYSVLSDSALREKLCNKGIERARLFTWEKTARETLDAYKMARKI